MFVTDQLPPETPIRKASAAISGPIDRANIINANSASSCGPALKSLDAAATAALPNISTGTLKGSTNNDSKTPAWFNETVSAAPIAPIRLSDSVPSSRLAIRTGIAGVGIFSSSASNGDNSSKGNPLSNQCTSTFASTISGKDCPLRTNCSRVPSAKSASNKAPNESNTANSALTQITPGAMVASVTGLGPTPSGNSVTTTTKNSSGFTH